MTKSIERDSDVQPSAARWWFAFVLIPLLVAAIGFAASNDQFLGSNRQSDPGNKTDSGRSVPIKPDPPTPSPPAAAVSYFVGPWQGTMQQVLPPGQHPMTISLDVTLESRNSAIGRVSYADLGCSGELRNTSVDDTALILTFTIVNDPQHACVPTGYFVLTQLGVGQIYLIFVKALGGSILADAILSKE